MSVEDQPRRNDAFSVLGRFTRKRGVAEQCEFCSRGVGPDHQHLIEPATRRLTCVCDACAVLFPGGQAKYRRVPRGVRFLPEFQMTDAQWESLLIPIELAFFYHSSQARRIVALYPSPAGPTESLLPLETWQDIVRDNPVLAGMEPDVEGLMANRLGHRRGEAFHGDHAPEYCILPIDECFKLVGLIRLHWKGLSGGHEVWTEIAKLFSDLRLRASGSHEALRA